VIRKVSYESGQSLSVMRARLLLFASTYLPTLKVVKLVSDPIVVGIVPERFVPTDFMVLKI
jgi:hypothetical protein